MTTTTALPPASLPPPTSDTPAPQTSCPNCGTAIQSATETQAALAAAHARIADLEAQVRLLNQKAAAAIDRWADYEDELSRLRASAAAAAVSSPTTTTTTAPPSPWSSVASPSRPSFLPAAAASRITSLLSPRKSTPNLRGAPASPQAPPPPPPPPHWQQHQQHSSTGAIAPPSPSLGTGTGAGTGTEDLLEALSREQSLRRAAESRLSTTSREVEELSVALFEQANEMVATERRARARLAERVEVLEKRDADKRRRLERLEQAVGRIDRARSLLGGGAATATSADARPASGPLPARPLPEQLMLA